MNDYEIALMHANGEPVPDSDHARQLYRDLDEVVAMLGAHRSGQEAAGSGSAIAAPSRRLRGAAESRPRVQAV